MNEIEKVTKAVLKRLRKQRGSVSGKNSQYNKKDNDAEREVYKKQKEVHRKEREFASAPGIGHIHNEECEH